MLIPALLEVIPKFALFFTLQESAVRTLLYLPTLSLTSPPRSIATHLIRHPSAKPSRLALGYAIIVKRLANYFRNIL